MKPRRRTNAVAVDGAASGGSKKKRNIWIAGCVAGALVLGVAVATPLIVQSLRDRELAELTAEIGHTYGATDDALADLEAATALSSLQYTEATGFVKDVSALGKTADPVLTKPQSKSITDAAAAASKALGDEPKESDERTAAVKLVESKIEELRQADKDAAAKAKKEKKKAPAATAPASFLALSVDDVRGVIGDDADAANVEPDPRASESGDKLEAARDELETAKEQLKSAQDAVDAELELSSTVTDAVAGTLPALVEASEGAPAQAKVVVTAASKSGDASKNVTTAADAAKQTAGEKAATAVQVREKLAAYVDAAQVAQKVHADAVAAEEAAAAEPAQGGGEYVGDGGYNGESGYDDGWGGWAPDQGAGGGAPDPGAGGGAPWTPPVDAGGSAPQDGGGGAPAGGGGAPAGGGGGGAPAGGGGGAPVDGGGGGGAPPATTCPPGTFPSGSWDNIHGVHCIPDGGGDQTGW